MKKALKSCCIVATCGWFTTTLNKKRYYRIVKLVIEENRITAKEKIVIGEPFLGEDFLSAVEVVKHSKDDRENYYEIHRVPRMNGKKHDLNVKELVQP